MIRKILFYVVVVFLVLLLLALSFNLLSLHKKNRVLEESVKQYQKIVEQKEQELAVLQSQIEALQKEQVLREKRLSSLKRQRKEIKPPTTDTELVQKFRELGYEAHIR